MTRLVTESKIGDDLAIALEVGPPEVSEQSFTSADHLEESAAAVMVLRVSAEVLGEVVDVLCENRNLDLCRAGISAVRAVLLDRSCLLKCH